MWHLNWVLIWGENQIGSCRHFLLINKIILPNQRLCADFLLFFLWNVDEFRICYSQFRTIIEYCFCLAVRIFSKIASCLRLEKFIDEEEHVKFTILLENYRVREVTLLLRGLLQLLFQVHCFDTNTHRSVSMISSAKISCPWHQLSFLFKGKCPFVLALPIGISFRNESTSWPSASLNC